MPYKSPGRQTSGGEMCYIRMGLLCHLFKTVMPHEPPCIFSLSPCRAEEGRIISWISCCGSVESSEVAGTGSQVIQLTFGARLDWVRTVGLVVASKHMKNLRGNFWTRNTLCTYSAKSLNSGNWSFGALFYSCCWHYIVPYSGSKFRTRMLKWIDIFHHLWFNTWG